MGFAPVEPEQALVGSALVELALAPADSVLGELVLRWWILRLLRELYNSSSGVRHVS